MTSVTPELLADLFQTTLSAAITDAPASGTVETISVTSAASTRLQGKGQFRIKIDNEEMLVNGPVGTTTSWSVVRGSGGTATSTHLINATVMHILNRDALMGVMENWELGINVKDLNYGAIGDGVSDDTAALTAAINAAIALNAWVILPPGTYKVTSLPALSTCRGFCGAGSLATIIQFAADLGAGHYAMDCGFTTNTSPQGQHFMSGFTVRGFTGVVTVGTVNWNMDGVHFGNLDRALDVVSYGFHSGIVIDGGHIILESTYCLECWWGIRHIAPAPTQLGNNTFIGCMWTDCGHSSVSVAPGSATQYDLYEQCHFGFNPYGIYKESVLAPGQFGPGGNGTAAYFAFPNGEFFIEGCTFLMCTWEGIGNGTIFDNSGQAQMTGNTFIGTTGTGFYQPDQGSGYDVRHGSTGSGNPTKNPWSLPGGIAADWAIDVGTFLQNRFIGAGADWIWPGNKGMFRARILFQDFIQDDATVTLNTIENANGMGGYAPGAAGSIVYAECDTQSAISGVRCVYSGAECFVTTASGAISPGQVCYYAGVNGSYGASLSADPSGQNCPVIGVAVTQSSSSSVNGGLVVAEKGLVPVNISSKYTATQLDNLGYTPWLKPTPGANDGTVTLAASKADFAIGHMIYASGSQAQVYLNLPSGGGAMLTPSPVINFGTASDGSSTLDGTATVTWATLSANVYHQTRDSQCNNLTINVGVQLATNGWRVFCNGTLTVNGSVDNVGGPGGSGTNTGSTYGYEVGTATAGTGGVANAAAPVQSNVLGGAGGAGGNKAGGGSSPPPSSAGGTSPSPIQMLTMAANYVGGSGGGGGNTAAGGGGGGIIAVFARNIISNGGWYATGGAGASGTTYGAGGGGGGVVYLAYSSMTIQGGHLFSVAGGAGGSGSTANGSAGAIGQVIQVTGTSFSDIGAQPLDSVTNPQSGTTYTFAKTDDGVVVEANNASAVTFTIPVHTTTQFPLGAILRVYNAGAGALTVAAAGGVTIRGSTSVSQYGQLALRQRVLDEWVPYQ